MEAQPFEYASQPQAVSSKRKGGAAKYRPEDENDLALSNNIMFDRRVVRGNTYAAQVSARHTGRRPGERR